MLEVHTLHIRDFGGEKLIQALGDFQNYDICTACALEGVRAFLYPAGLIVRKCSAFAGLILAGMIMTLLLTVNDSWPAVDGIIAVRMIGPLAVIVGMIGIAGKVREILSVSDAVSKMNHDEAVRYSAWQLLLRDAPKKFGDNDIAYIPVSKDTLDMTPSLLAEKYDLLPSISLKAHEIMHEGE